MIALVVSALVVAGAYFVGSVPTGVLVARARGVDIQTVGSGNIGATNVARTLGRRAGALVLAIDAAKGALPAGVALWLSARGTVDPFVVAAAGVAAVAGHCFPVWLGFRGGKGVATSLGVLVVLDPIATGIAAALWLALYAAFRVASIGSLAAALALPPLLLAFDRADELVTLAIALALLIVAKHRANIARLLRRQEHRV
jgi:glycerol-3-phosphate acyltransferase PlsY